jgi:hypothetical protein
VGNAVTSSRKPLAHVFHNVAISYQKQGEFKKARDAYKSAADGGSTMSESFSDPGGGMPKESREVRGVG